MTPPKKEIKTRIATTCTSKTSTSATMTGSPTHKSNRPTSRFRTPPRTKRSTLIYIPMNKFTSA